MKKIFSGFKDEQDGAIAIEACISLTLFLIVMIALYSVIQVFTVQSMISHAMQEACQSMALENYNQSMFKTGTLQQIPSKVFDWISGDIEKTSVHRQIFHGKNCCFHRPRLQEKHRQLCMTVMQNRGSQLIWGEE